MLFGKFLIHSERRSDFPPIEPRKSGVLNIREKSAFQKETKCCKKEIPFWLKRNIFSRTFFRLTLSDFSAIMYLEE